MTPSQKSPVSWSADSVVRIEKEGRGEDGWMCADVEEKKWNWLSAKKGQSAIFSSLDD